jgi:carbon-monoxide dehydrogenase large subunit
MPYASEVPDIDIDHQQTPSPLNPLGIKGAGEAGVIPGTATIASAIEDAVGRRIAAMPISPTQLYDLVRSPDSEMTATAKRRAGTGVMA